MRDGEPALYYVSGQCRMADSATFRELLKRLEIVLEKPERDLLCARGSNLDVEILEFVAEFLKTVATPELVLRVIALETRKLALSINHFHLPLPRRHAR